MSYGLTNADTSSGRFGRQFAATSRDGGKRFLAPTAVGPPDQLRLRRRCAQGIFPGDYIGSALTRGRLYTVWAVASRPPRPGARYHQVLYGASFDTTRGPLPAAAIDEESEVLRP